MRDSLRDALRNSIGLRLRGDARGSALAQCVEVALQVALAYSSANSGSRYVTQIDTLFRRDFQYDGRKPPRTASVRFSFTKSSARRLHRLWRRSRRGLRRRCGIHLRWRRLRRSFRRDDFQFCRSFGARRLDYRECRADRQCLPFGCDDLRDSSRPRRRYLGVHLVG
jgi:hypothetical protein